MTFVIENLTDQTELIDNFGAALKEFYNYEPYNKYIDEMEERATRKSEGKTPVKASVGYFSGFGKGTLNNK